MIKRVTAIFLVLLFSIESFAAIVSDNDGSAFITKAEFDSLKNDFQAQIDNYNTSIDSKIDGAIAAYLAGIKVTTNGTETVLYFKGFSDDNVKDVTMRDPSSIKSTYGYGRKYINFGFSSLYTYEYATSANGYLKNTNYSYSNRRLLTYDKGTKKYRWAGWTDKWQETTNMTAFVNAGSQDTGYDNANPYIFVPYTTSYNRTSVRDNATTGWYLGLGEGGASNPYRSATAVTVSFDVWDYELKYTKDLIYSEKNWSTTSNVYWYSDQCLWYVDGNPNKRFWAGQSKKYSDTSWTSVGGSARVQWGGTTSSSVGTKSVQSSVKTNKGTLTSYWVSTAPENIKSWKTILANDTQTYYDRRNDTNISNYNICNGMPVIEAEPNYEYQWPVSFSGETKLFLKWGVFDENNANISDTDRIKIQFSTDGGKTWSDEATSATLTSGIIKWKADAKGGLIFCKWTNERTLTTDSKTINWTKEN